MQHLFKTFATASVCLALLACQSATQATTTESQPRKTGQISNKKAMTQPTQSTSNLPSSYTTWLEQDNNRQQIENFEKYLKKHRADGVAPTYQLVKSARSWKQCGHSEYELADTKLWDNLIPVLKLMRHLKDQGILQNYEITSIYRNPTLNQCAGGAKNSRHTHNAAVDFRIGSRQPNEAEQQKIAQIKAKLCKFWREHGEQYQMGLGVYQSGIIHIDTTRYRSWGHDTTQNTSICLVKN